MDTLSSETRAGLATEERFELLRVLGKGGMGNVYQARERETGELFALKELHERHADNEVLVARLEREARFASRIRHANVAIVDGIVEQGDRRFLKMEYVEGTTLEEILQARKRLSPKVTLRLMDQICAGVQAAHDQGLVHRDLKPANVMVCAKDGRAVILDFGVAKSDRDGEFTQTGVVLGSLDYMSPEQLSGYDVTARADVYSLGVLLYEMLTGVCPFRMADAALPLRLELRQQVEDPRQHVPELPAFLVDAIAKCLDPHPEDRYASPAELGEFLRERPDETGNEEKPHVVLVGGNPVLVNAAPLAVVASPPGALRYELAGRLGRLGCRVAPFEDGRDALIYSLQHHCHVLILCDTTEGMDPWEACAVMKRYARFDSTRLLVLAADVDAAQTAADRALAGEVLGLPLDGDDFARRIRRLLD